MVHLNSVIGKDREGQIVLDHCNLNGILTDAILEKEQLQTVVNVVLSDECGERHFLTGKNGSFRKLTLQDIRIPADRDDCRRKHTGKNGGCVTGM